ncbi:hypothetical protein L484_015720 [Morus notabilis]|uniref:Uncharacterized protein n=1 Tax=Morus notabilis TaxID=981085 RepID=W9S0D0_9ROSA|nr:hypothetical protein L484_015720 [Morus notabilis]
MVMFTATFIAFWSEYSKPPIYTHVRVVKKGCDFTSPFFGPADVDLANHEIVRERTGKRPGDIDWISDYKPTAAKGERGDCNIASEPEQGRASRAGRPHTVSSNRRKVNAPHHKENHDYIAPITNFDHHTTYGFPPKEHQDEGNKPPWA